MDEKFKIAVHLISSNNSVMEMSCSENKAIAETTSRDSPLSLPSKDGSNRRFDGLPFRPICPPPSYPQPSKGQPMQQTIQSSAFPTAVQVMK